MNKLMYTVCTYALVASAVLDTHRSQTAHPNTHSYDCMHLLTGSQNCKYPEYLQLQSLEDVRFVFL